MLAVPLAAPTRLTPLVSDAPDSARVRGGSLPSALEDRYGGPLAIALRTGRPTVVANFVSTLDGVVSYNTPEAAGGGEISGFFEPDRFVMGLLRAVADVVLIGAGTLRAGVGETWTPESVHPASAAAYAALRAGLGLRPRPVTAVVTASGSVDLDHPGLADPGTDVLLITTDAGAAALAHQQPPAHVQVRAIGGAVRTEDILRLLADAGARVVLCEGGPHLLGQLLRDRLVDELFLTLAPQIAGRSDVLARPGLAEGVAFDVASAPWAMLTDLRRAGDHLFARYRLKEEPGS
ncbi:MAG TPA: dihydrofolate reductase family protein [Candidatus Limnocylindria bacterium]|nr:dihydrofolate reductase family protein [Candidatus Limnocylindria bacterium]